MALSIAIVGLPNVGKSTLFKILTKKTVDIANYPFCTIDPNIGVVKVPDSRLELLAKVSKTNKIIPTSIEFVDVAGLVSGASQGEGLGNQFLAHIRECDAICEVIRGFRDDNIIHVSGKLSPSEDVETINLELVLADLATVNRALEKNKKDRGLNSKEHAFHYNTLKKLEEHLSQGKSLRSIDFSTEELVFIKSLHLLSIKPIIYLLNIDDDYKAGDIALPNLDGEVLTIKIKLEEEIASLGKEEQDDFIKELGLELSGLDKLIASAYKLLDLETFFTTGVIETRAWTIKKGAKAPEAAGVIHSDFEKNFIRAEVINWHDLVKAGSELAAKEAGLIKTEGKDYLIKDGDVCHFLANP